MYTALLNSFRALSLKDFLKDILLLPPKNYLYKINFFGLVLGKITTQGTFAAPYLIAVPWGAARAKVTQENIQLFMAIASIWRLSKMSWGWHIREHHFKFI